MTKITVHETETPSEAIIKAANQALSVTDARGRVITLKEKLGPLDRMRMFEVIGADNSKNEQYMGVAALAFLVTSIDGDPVSRPSSKLQLEALVQRLDDDGIQAMGVTLEQRYTAMGEAQSEVDALKN